VQLGPAGVQWCSNRCWRRSPRIRRDRPAHPHASLETIYQRAWADANFPDGIVRYLRDIGFLSDRLTLAHCIHARPDEIEIIAASGARIVTNFSSNMHLRSASPRSPPRINAAAPSPSASMVSPSTRTTTCCAKCG
jgi:Cytosine deaminase and related metal-dependent hydrolases